MITLGNSKCELQLPEKNINCVSCLLQEVFQVAGFSVSGRVITKTGVSVRDATDNLLTFERSDCITHK